MANSTLVDLYHEMYLLLNEPNATAFGELESGVDATPTISALLAAAQYIDTTATFIASNLPFIEGWGKYTALPVGTSRLMIHDPLIIGNMGRATVVLGDGSQLTGIREVLWNGNKLTPCSMDTLRLEVDDAERPQQAATVKYWYPLGENWFGIYPAPSSIQMLEVFGWVRPGKITTGTQDVPYASDYRARWLALGGAALLGRDNMDDPRIEPRVVPIAAEFDSLMAASWDNIPEATRKAWFPSLPFFLGGKDMNRTVKRK